MYCFCSVLSCPPYVLAIFDFGAEGPIFGADALKIPLGRAPSMGSSYAAIGGDNLFGGGKEIRTAKSRLGSVRRTQKEKNKKNNNIGGYK